MYSLSTSAPQLQQSQYGAQQLAAVSLQSQQPSLPNPVPSVLPQPGIAIPTSLATSQVATVSYPAPRSTQPHTPKQRVFTGTVTKLHDNFGFVDEDVFFQTSCVKGTMPKAGERVLVEASYNANMPFKWNATRIQLLPGQAGTTSAGLATVMTAAPLKVGGQTMVAGPAPPSLPPPVGNIPQTLTQAVPSAVGPIVTSVVASSISPGLAPPQITPQPPPLMAQTPQPTVGLLAGPVQPVPVQRPGSLQGQPRAEQVRFPSLKNDRDKERERGRDRERRERRENRRKHSRSPGATQPRSRSPVTRPRSPVRRRTPRIIPRYVVQIPKLSLDVKEANVIILKSRYSNMYIPSDFFHTCLNWTDAFPLSRPFRLGVPCAFHIMQKDVEPLQANDTVLEPPDADHIFSAKVMLLASHNITDLYHKCCSLAEDSFDLQENFQHPTRLLNFLVGVRGKNEPMAIGGPWSPSLDGLNPAEDPNVLIKTAIRTTKALTGIDLGGCTQWYRFAEIHYLRPEGTHKGRQLPSRVETVVLFLPDIWTCVPSRLEWGTLKAAYAKQLQRKISPETKDDPSQAEEEDGDAETAEPKRVPKHHSELDPKTMKILDLRCELESRHLSAKGLKSQLIARLTKSLRSEQEKEEEEAEKELEQKPFVESKSEGDQKDEMKKKEEEDRKRKDKRDKIAIERKYSLPEEPAIIVHPSPTAKNGKFDCALMSLSVLLDYRPEDNKEHSFEVSLFAEMFNEMLMRDFGYQIYRALAIVAPKKEEKTKESKDSNSQKRKCSEKENPEKKDGQEKIKEEGEKSKGEDNKEEEVEEEEVEDEEDQEETDNKEEGKKSKETKGKKKEKRKFVTEDPSLLLAFVYFDQNHTGYILDKDVEEIIHTIGLHLSRAQVKKLVQKVVSRDTLNYRKLTDCPVQGGAESFKEERQSPDEDKLSSGNTEYLFGLRSLRLASSESKINKGKESENASNIVNYKGALLNIESLLQRLEKSENTRQTVEDKLKEMSSDMASMKTSHQDSKAASQKLSENLQAALLDLEGEKRANNDLEDKNKHLMDTLTLTQESLSKTLESISTALVQGDVDRALCTQVKMEIDK